MQKQVDALRAWFGVPEGVISLFFIQIFCTLSYSVLYSSLALYLSGPLQMSHMTANSITGVFLAFNYALHLLGGYFGGRFFSYRLLFLIGMVAQIIGCVLLAEGGEQNLYFGLGTFLVGAGLNVTCVNCMLTQRFDAQDSKRETAFLYNYAGMNIGFFVGFSVSGYFQLTQSYSSLFMFGATGNVIAALLILFAWKSLHDTNTDFASFDARTRQRMMFIGALLVGVMPFALSQLLHYAFISNVLVLSTGAAMLFATVWLALRQTRQMDKEKMMAFALFLLVCTIFWTLYQLAPMGTTHFINHNVNRNLLDFEIPPQWFQNINTVCIVCGGPLMSFALQRLRSRGINVNVPTQFALALGLIAAAMMLIPAGIARADTFGMVSIEWVMASFVLISIAELLLSPIGYAMIGSLIPARLQGLMMGIWMLAMGVGGTLASYCSNWMTAGVSGYEPLVTNPGYSRVFFDLGILAFASCAILYFLLPTLKRWVRQSGSANDKEGSLAELNS